MIFGIIFVLAFGFFAVQKDRAVAGVNCLLITSSSPEADKEVCKNELASLEAEFAALLAKQNEQKKNTGTLQGDINYINSQIKALNAKIKARSYAVAQLKVSISEKSNKIKTLEEKIEDHHESLGQLVRNTNQYDDSGLVYLLLSDESIFSFYNDIESYSSIKQAIKSSVDEILGVKTETETEKKTLEQKKDAETNAKYELEIAEKKVTKTETEKKKLLEISKEKEEEYLKLAAEKKARADKIRSALIQFQGNGISRSISFGKAYDYAKLAEEKTGVRAAFIMAIMQQETGFGNNVGGCNIRDGETGEGIYVKSGNTSWRNMVPGHFEAFLRITSALGRDWRTTPISCALVEKDGSLYGYGGAMGYTQFIPGTWELVDSRVEKYLGIDLADPWNPRDAVMATGVFMMDKGADAQTYTAEYKAACRYYGSCSRYDYGSSVMKKVTAIQTDIDLLSD